MKIVSTISINSTEIKRYKRKPKRLTENPRRSRFVSRLLKASRKNKISHPLNSGWYWLVIIALFTASGWVPAATNQLGWSPEQAQRWSQLYTLSHPLWQRLKSEADAPDIADDDGIRDGLVYLITADINYAQSAYKHISYWAGKRSPGTEPSHDDTAQRFASLALLYSWVADALPPRDKNNFKDILAHWTDLVLNSHHGTDIDDSRELSGHYFGVTLYALAIQNDHPDLAKQLLESKTVGGLSATSTNRDTWRNALSDFTRRSVGGGWLEGSESNLATVFHYLEYSHTINEFFGRDHFPKVTDLIPDFEKTFAQELTPDLVDSFQWGDLRHAHDLALFYRVPLLSLIARLTDNPETAFLADSISRDANEPHHSHFYLYVDPNAKLATPSGWATHNANGRGLAYYRSDWAATDSFFGSWHQTPSATVRDSGLATNFGLFRANQWVIDYPRGYQLSAGYGNTLLISGALESAEEARGQIGFEAGDTFLYHVGATGGRSMASTGRIMMPELLHEWTRSYLYLHNPDGSDTVIIFDRLNTSNPLTDIKPAQLGLLSKATQSNITAVNGQHQWIIHLPDANPQVNGNTISWNAAGGESVDLFSFLSSRYSTQVASDQSFNLSSELDPNELGYQLRLIPTQKSGWQTLLNVVHSGSTAVTSQYSAASGQKAEAVLVDTGSESTLAIFNGDPGALPFKANGNPVAIQPSDSQSGLDRNRLVKLDQLRFFKSGFRLKIDTKTPTKVYLADLDPNLAWSVSIDGSSQPLTPGKSGLAQFHIAVSGPHSISVDSQQWAATPPQSSNPAPIPSFNSRIAPQSVTPPTALATAEIIVDNRDQADTSSTGIWRVSSGSNPWAGESRYSNGGSAFRWFPTIQAAGQYKVYAWWTHHTNRATNVPYRIKHSNGTATVRVNQRDSSLGGQWNLLGTYNFPSGSSSYVEVSSESGQANADAIRLVPVSSVSGIVVDNDDQSRTNTTGTWKTSAGPNPWGAGSVYSNSGARFKWTPNILSAGQYKVYAWWTHHNNRATNVPYRIKHSNGTATVRVNQRDGSLGGQWNLLGTYHLPAGSSAYVEVSSENGQANADAVRLVKTNQPPPPPNNPVHWWQRKIDSAPLHPNSASQISTLSQLGGFGLGRMQIDFGLRVVNATASDPKIPFAANKFGIFVPDSDPQGTLIPVPAGATIEGSNNMTCGIDNQDCHYLVKQGKTLYETWQATRASGQLKARLLVIWDLSQTIPASGRGDHCTSADAAGFPMEPLLWDADEIQSSISNDPSGGDLGHAIRFILPNNRMASDSSLGGVGGRLYVRPASHAGGPSGPKGSVAYGARLRLRANFPTAGYNPAARVVINTMKRYGIALSDGGNIALTAESDIYTQTKWSDLGIGSRVFDATPGARAIQISDFQVVDTGPRIPETFNCVRN